MKERLLGADFLAAEGRAGEAVPLSAAAVRTFEALLPADHPKVVAARGLLRRLQGNREEP